MFLWDRISCPRNDNCILDIASVDRQIEEESLDKSSKRRSCHDIYFCSHCFMELDLCFLSTVSNCSGLSKKSLFRNLKTLAEARKIISSMNFQVLGIACIELYRLAFIIRHFINSYSLVVAKH
jgi:hypothetical protein